jgi:hypothetical protein
MERVDEMKTKNTAQKPREEEKQQQKTFLFFMSAVSTNASFLAIIVIPIRFSKQ